MNNIVQTFRKNIQTYTLIIALILIWAIFTVATQGGYVSPQNISNLFRQMAITSLMAAGMLSLFAGATPQQPSPRRWETVKGLTCVFPLLANTRIEGKVVDSQEVLKIEKRSIGEDVFSLPGGYRKQSVGDILK